MSAIDVTTVKKMSTVSLSAQDTASGVASITYHSAGHGDSRSRAAASGAAEPE